MEQDKVIAQIKKVLRLARGTSEAGERAAAEATARRLADKHGIRLDMLDETDEVKNVMETDARLRSFGIEDGMACGLLRQHFSVVCLVEQFGRFVRYIWFGNPLNIDVAKHVQHIVVREAKRAWADYRREHPKAVRSAFMQGWFVAINRTLTLNPLRNDVLQARSEARQAERKYLEWRDNIKRETGADVADREVKPRRGRGNELVAGLQAGMGVNLTRPVGNTGVQRERLAAPAARLTM